VVVSVLPVRGVRVSSQCHRWKLGVMGVMVAHPVLRMKCSMMLRSVPEGNATCPLRTAPSGLRGNATWIVQGHWFRCSGFPNEWPDL